MNIRGKKKDNLQLQNPDVGNAPVEDSQQVEEAVEKMEELSRVTAEGIKKADKEAIKGIDEEFLAEIKVQEDELKRNIPDFDLAAEIEKNPMFAVMLSFNEPMERVYEYFNPEYVYREIEKEILERIKSRNLRPAPVEQRGKAGGFDINNLSRKDMEEIDKRVRRGERIEL